MNFIPQQQLPYGLAEQLVRMREAEPSNYAAIAKGIASIVGAGQEAYTKYNTDNPKTQNLQSVMQAMYPQQAQSPQAFGGAGGTQSFGAQMKAHDFSTQYGMPQDLFGSIRWH